MRVEELTLNHIDEAISIFHQKYQKSVQNNSLLPMKYLNKDEIRPRLEWFISNFGGVAAIEENQMVGYMTGVFIEQFKSSHNGYYVPEFAHAVLDDDKDIFNELYLNRINEWSKNARIFAYTLLKEEKNVAEELYQTGHGILLMDGIRKAEGLMSYNETVQVRLATLEDIPQLVPVFQEHLAYLEDANTFLFIGEANCEEELKEWIEENKSVLFIAHLGDEVVGFMRCVIGGGDAAMIIQDDDILKIMGTHVLEKVQNQGIAKTLLHHANLYALEHHCSRLSVDFESSNFKARRFWLKHFISPSYSVIRFIDDRIK